MIRVIRLVLGVMASLGFTALAFVGTLTLYELLTQPSTAMARPDPDDTKIATIAILVAWAVAVPLASAWLIRRSGGTRLLGFGFGFLIMVPTLLVMAYALSYTNECHTGGYGYPIEFADCH